MISDRGEYARRLKLRISSIIDDLCGHIGHGSIPTNESYDRQVGIVQGLEQAVELLTEVSRAMDREQGADANYERRIGA